MKKFQLGLWILIKQCFTHNLYFLVNQSLFVLLTFFDGKDVIRFLSIRKKQLSYLNFIFRLFRQF